MNRGDVAQLGERFNRTEEVEGSNPFVSTYGVVAHLGERFNGIEEVEGSNPFDSTNIIFDCRFLIELHMLFNQKSTI